MDVVGKILKYRDLHGLSNPKLAALLGVDRSLPGKWESGKAYPSRNNFPQFAKAMGITIEELQSGTDEENGTSVPKPQSGKIPFFDAVAMGGQTILADQTPVYEPTEMIEPGTWFKQASGALRVYGHSMFPKYPSGCIVAFKVSTSSVIVWGEDYVIELSDRRIVKRVEKGEDKESIRAVSYNVNKDQKYIYDPIDIPRSEIKRMYIVLGKVELEASV
jgi:transcriptional regulator with XRE-family HTH domain